MFCRTRNTTGFTLIELVIAVGMFAILVTIAVGGFAHALRAQRQANALIAVNSSVSEAIEQMAREIRTGHGFCNATTESLACDDGISYAMGCAPEELAFLNARGEFVKYFRDAGNSVFMREVWTDNPMTGCRPVQGAITGSNVLVEAFNVILLGNASGDGRQVRVTVSIGVRSYEARLSALGPTILQTTISSRYVDD